MWDLAKGCLPNDCTLFELVDTMDLSNFFVNSNPSYIKNSFLGVFPFPSIHNLVCWYMEEKASVMDSTFCSFILIFVMKIVVVVVFSRCHVCPRALKMFFNDPFVGE